MKILSEFEKNADMALAWVMGEKPAISDHHEIYIKCKLTKYIRAFKKK